MADKPINQAPEETGEIYAIYGREDALNNRLVQYPENQFAHAVGKTVANKGEMPYIDAKSAFASTLSASSAAEGTSTMTPAVLMPYSFASSTK